MLIFVLGGARSGKSGVAESLVHNLPGPVTYVATIVPDPDDADLLQRIAAHQSHRPPSWRTVEASSALPDQLRELDGTVLIDSLGPWVSLHGSDDAASAGLLAALATRAGDTVVVSEEVGMSVHPSSPQGRAFRDALGRLNQRVAGIADRSLFVVAGQVLATRAFHPSDILDGGA
jgi:adenosylcobinamide kinase/adenosylcobinamide-phosphate guanylyltransferase